MKSVITLASMVLTSSAFASGVSLECKSADGVATVEGKKMFIDIKTEGLSVVGELKYAGTLSGYDSSDDVLLYRNARFDVSAQVQGKKVTVFHGNDVVSNMNCK